MKVNGLVETKRFKGGRFVKKNKGTQRVSWLPASMLEVNALHTITK